MLIIIILILLILMIVGLILDWNGSGGGFVLIISAVSCGVIAVAALIVCLVNYPFGIEKKLQMYEEENLNIEAKVKETVQAYMNYEKDIYTNLVESENLETLLIKYPELNSNELVKAQIETYKENSNKIKKLKEANIIKPTLAWWLYFGK